MNRWLAILILSFGTAILVAHAAIPHHHHEGVACFHHDEGKTHAEDASHQHNPTNPLDYNCSLKQLFLIPAGKRSLITSLIQLPRDFSALFLLAVPVAVPPPFHVLSGKRSPSFTAHTFPDPVLNSSGPRAPPFI